MVLQNVTPNAASRGWNTRFEKRSSVYSGRINKANSVEDSPEGENRYSHYMWSWPDEGGQYKNYGIENAAAHLLGMPRSSKGLNRNLNGITGSIQRRAGLRLNSLVSIQEI
jgi:hypothetical protein